MTKKEATERIPTKARALLSGPKLCSSCRVMCDRSMFNRNSRAGDGLQSKCRACQKAYIDSYAKTDHGKARLRASTERHRTGSIGVCKEKARRMVKREVAAGRMISARSQRCCVCWSGASELHHDSYRVKGDWLKVRPLCKRCHDQWHRQNKAAEPSTYTLRRHGRVSK